MAAFRRLFHGLSPRMRGNQSKVTLKEILDGSIPAHAGEPGGHCLCSSVKGVYPRACGGTHVPKIARAASSGLSPRMRGNHRYDSKETVFYGSIPAHAGEPRKHWGESSNDRVYPRACGGTITVFRSQQHARGLSPRMRGNHSCERSKSSVGGSIPAHAGEPSITAVNPIRAPGLSPRMRGNHAGRDATSVFAGSIPAHAGEPVMLFSFGGLWRVYPRACGGTSMGPRHEPPTGGLSPRMRGNRSIIYAYSL